MPVPEKPDISNAATRQNLTHSNRSEPVNPSTACLVPQYPE
jgi:hypothetical protein